MKQRDISMLLQGGESQTLELKRSLSLQREALESLCGMVNADAGRGEVVFGVGPDGTVVGVEPGDLDKAQQSLSQVVGQKFEPKLTIECTVAEIAKKKVVILGGKRSPDVPYHECGGRAFTREGTVTRQLTLAEKQSLQRKRNRDLHSGPWRCSGCGRLVGTLSSFELTAEGMKKSYRCTCGGEFWPVN